VVVAAALVGLIVGPLAGSFSAAVQQARAEREGAVEPGGEGGDIEADPGAAWQWGTRVVAAWWRPGPELHVRVSGPEAASEERSAIGLWVDGWLVEQISLPDAPGGSGEVTVGAATWTDLADRELVVRGRTGEGVWGPPWRLAIPTGSAGDPDKGATEAPMGAEPFAAVHRPMAGTLRATGSWGMEVLPLPVFPLLLVLGDPGVLGWAGVTLDGRSQWWRAEEGRSVDLYY
jgi:hypothetical protein